MTYRPAARVVLLDERERILLCFAPGRMAELLPSLIAGDYPAEPIDAGV